MKHHVQLIPEAGHIDVNFPAAEAQLNSDSGARLRYATVEVEDHATDQFVILKITAEEARALALEFDNLADAMDNV